MTQADRIRPIVRPELLVVDHPMFLEGLCWCCPPEPDVEVIGAAKDGNAAVSAALDLQPMWW